MATQTLAYPYPIPSLHMVATCPLKIPAMPFCRYSLTAQSRGPAYSLGVTSGWVCSPVCQLVYFSYGDDNVRILICSTGFATTVFATPANAPDAHNCPRPSSAPTGFRPLKNRLARSRAANWIETQAPIPSKGVSVPWGISTDHQSGGQYLSHLFVAPTNHDGKRQKMLTL